MKHGRKSSRPWLAAAATVTMLTSLLAAPVAVADEGRPTIVDEPSGQVPLTGNISVHDPTMYTDGEWYYIADTHDRLRRAPAMEGPWELVGRIPRAQWTDDLLDGGLWAPAVQEIDGTYYYYYSTSQFGTNNSAIGLKTTETPGDPSSYVDHGGPIITSGSVDPDNATHNAIDPDVWQDEDGSWWIVWGSHFDGIMVQQLDDDMTTLVGERQMVAHRESNQYPIEEPGCPYPIEPCPNFNRIEGPSIFSHGDYYYLMAAWDWCCRASGHDNTYKIVIGRSKNIEGPYLDKNGVDMAEGGGSIILDSRQAGPNVEPDTLWRTAGAPDVFVEDDVIYLTYHSHVPGSRMGIRPMNWHDDWPYFQEEGGGPYDLHDGGIYRLNNEGGDVNNNEELQNPVPSDRCLTAVIDGQGANAIQSECDDTLDQYWQMQFAHDGFFRWRSMAGDQDHCLAMADASGDIGTNVELTPCAEQHDLQEWSLDDTGHGYHRPVVKGANLALEVVNSCDPPGSYNCESGIGENVVGGVRRDGDHTSGNQTQAAKWPPQQWMLDMVSFSADHLVEEFEAHVTDGTLTGVGPGNSADGRLTSFGNRLESIREAMDAGDFSAAAGQLDAALKRLHTDGNPQASHHASGDGADELASLITTLRDAIS